MSLPPAAALLPDGKRLHLQQGPIDLVIQAFGDEAEVAAAYGQAAAAFPTILPRLVEELTTLRSAAIPTMALFGPVARRMLAAVSPHSSAFITPMAAVAGAVADEILTAMLLGRRLSRAYVNNGGDIALHLTAGTRFDIGMMVGEAFPGGVIEITADLPVRGIATSGWGGRSFSLGIADSVTVLATTAAAADAAATLIANAVDVEDPAIGRVPAHSLDPDSDLGERLVTVSVPLLSPAQVAKALAAGQAVAEAMRRRGLIHAACLSLQNHCHVLSPQPDQPVRMMR